MNARTAPTSPFDLLAPSYDETFTGTELGRRLRSAAWRHLDAAFPPGGRVLELGCGTGEDALHLAARGVTVVATDASPGMVALAKAKGEGPAAGGRVGTRVLSFEELPAAAASLGHFDGAFSNFGAVNCAGDLGALGRALAALLRPGAPLVLVAMGPFVPWEWAWFLARGAPRKAFRRLSRPGVAWRGLTIRYPSPRALARALSPAFRVRKLVALGALLPPSYAAGSLSPGALDRLDRLERRFEESALLAWLADHYLVVLARTART